MADLKYYVHSWKEIHSMEQVTQSYGEGDNVVEETHDSPVMEIQDLVIGEFETLGEANQAYESISDKVKCIYYTCDTHFEGLKTYKHSSFLDNVIVMEQAEKDILICAEDNNEEPPQ